MFFNLQEIKMSFREVSNVLKTHIRSEFNLDVDDNDADEITMYTIHFLKEKSLQKSFLNDIKKLLYDFFEKYPSDDDPKFSCSKAILSINLDSQFYDSIPYEYVNNKSHFLKKIKNVLEKWKSTGNRNVEYTFNIKPNNIGDEWCLSKHILEIRTFSKEWETEDCVIYSSINETCSECKMHISADAIQLFDYKKYINYCSRECKTRAQNEVYIFRRMNR